MNQVTRFLPVTSMSVFITIEYKEGRIAPWLQSTEVTSLSSTYYCNKALI